MGLTMAEKVLKRAGMVDAIKPGDYVTAHVDLVFLGDGMSDVYTIMKDAGIDKAWDPDKIVSLMDHSVPSPTIQLAEKYKIIREAVKKLGVRHAYGERAGICHQVLAEKGHALPGRLILGLDSHSTASGALAAPGTGVGYTEMAYIMKTGTIWLRVPETIKFNLRGKLNPGVMSKDIILKIAGDYTAEVAQYKSVEFAGGGARDLSIPGRLCMTSMGVDIGAKFALFASDDKTFEYLKGRTTEPLEHFGPDPDAVYAAEYDIEVASLDPQVAMPHKIDNVRDIHDVGDVKIDQAFLGSCTNARLEDLAMAAEIMKGRKVHPDVRMIIMPASWKEYSDAMHLGYMDTFIEAGAIVCNPGCGPCCGTHMGILGSGERCIGTHNRNFQGRMGSSESEVYLASPATVAASAVEGKIADPRDHLP